MCNNIYWTASSRYVAGLIYECLIGNFETVAYYSEMDSLSGLHCTKERVKMNVREKYLFLCCWNSCSLLVHFYLMTPESDFFGWSGKKVQKDISLLRAWPTSCVEMIQFRGTSLKGRFETSSFWRKRIVVKIRGWVKKNKKKRNIEREKTVFEGQKPKATNSHWCQTDKAHRVLHEAGCPSTPECFTYTYGCIFTVFYQEWFSCWTLPEKMQNIDTASFNFAPLLSVHFVEPYVHVQK